MRNLLDWMQKRKLPDDFKNRLFFFKRSLSKAKNFGPRKKDQRVSERGKDDYCRDQAPVVVITLKEAHGILDVRDYVGSDNQLIEHEEFDDQEAVLDRGLPPELGKPVF